MLVVQCPTNAMHSFQIRSLRSLGFQTRVALSNKSHLRPDLRTDYRVDLSIYPAGRDSMQFVENIGLLPADGRLMFDCSSHDRGERDAVFVFHLVPVRFADRRTADIERDELMFLASIQDHYVEYFRDGCAAGVLYQNGPFNHPKLSPKGTTLIQAPKFYVSTKIDSLLSVINASADPTYDRVARLQLCLVGEGIQVAWQEDVEPFVPLAVSVRDRLRAHGVPITATPRFVCLYAVCANATVIPLTIVRDDETGSIGLEHSLPPSYYSTVARDAVFGRLVESGLFEVAS